MAGVVLKSIFTASLLLVAVPQSTFKQARLSLIQKDYGAAIRLLEQEQAAKLKKGDQTPGLERLQFLIANTKLLGGDRRGAEAGFEGLLKQYPKSVFAHLAEYGRARCRACGATRTGTA